MNTKRLFQIIVLAFIFLITSCAGVTKTPYVPDAERPIKTIALVRVPDHEKYALQDFGNPLGVVAGGINAATKTSRFNDMLRKNGFTFSKRMEHELVRGLRRAGFKVILVDVERKNPMSLLSDYGSIGPGRADAILDVAARTIGYSSVKLTDPDYRPHLDVLVQLVRSGGGRILYGEHILYGYHNPLMGATEITAPKKYYFATFDLLMQNQRTAAGGLKKGVSAIVTHVAKTLGK